MIEKQRTNKREIKFLGRRGVSSWTMGGEERWAPLRIYEMDNKFTEKYKKVFDEKKIK